VRYWRSSRADLFRREQYWLDRIHDSQFGKSVYNLRKRVDNHWHVDDQKRKRVGEKVSEGLKKRYLDPVLGPASRARRRKLKESFDDPVLGPAYRAKISQRTKEAMADPAVRLKLGASKGKKLSAEHRRKIGDGGRGVKRSSETRARSSADRPTRRGISAQCPNHGRLSAVSLG
jgi:hypothetical protein